MAVLPANPLDPALVTQAVPPGSMRYYALLFAPPHRRDVLIALHLLEDELNATARGTHHDVAHTRLKWWSEEIERFKRGQPAHPATRTLHAGRNAFGDAVPSLRGLVDAAAMDLALVTYSDEAELAAYYDRSGGLLGELAARWLLEPHGPSAAALKSARSMGALVRQAESLRDLRSHLVAGRIHLPMTALDREGIDLPELRQQPWTPATLAFVQARRLQLETALIEAMLSVPAGDQAALRPLLVLAALHLQLLRQLERDLPRNPPVLTELAPFAKLWHAWRTARRAR